MSHYIGCCLPYKQCYSVFDKTSRELLDSNVIKFNNSSIRDHGKKISHVYIYVTPYGASALQDRLHLLETQLRDFWPVPSLCREQQDDARKVGFDLP